MFSIELQKQYFVTEKYCYSGISQMELCHLRSKSLECRLQREIWNGEKRGCEFKEMSTYKVKGLGVQKEQPRNVAKREEGRKFFRKF